MPPEIRLVRARTSTASPRTNQPDHLVPLDCDGVQAVGFKGDLDLVLTDTRGNVIADSMTDGPRSEKIRITLPPGRYVAFVFSDAGSVEPAGKYRIKATALGDGETVEPN